MRHAKAEDLDRVEDLIVQLRAVDGLKEKSRGRFYLRSRSFLHFHEHEGDIVCDVRLDGAHFERRVVTSKSAQRQVVKDVLVCIDRLSAGERRPVRRGVR